jgi:hypothetical protein
MVAASRSAQCKETKRWPGDAGFFKTRKVGGPAPARIENSTQPNFGVGPHVNAPLIGRGTCVLQALKVNFLKLCSPCADKIINVVKTSIQISQW